MENVLLVYVILMGAILMILMFQLFRSSGESERRLAKVRVRTGETRQPAQIEPEEEEFDHSAGQALLIGGALVILIILISSLQ